MPIWGLDPIFRMTRRDTLLQRILAANLLLFVLVLFAATLIAQLDLQVADERREFVVLALSMVLVLLVNFVLLRRRFDPLERLIEGVERIDPANTSGFRLPEEPGPEEIARLAASFRRLLERIEAERNRSGRLVLRGQEEERRRIARDLHDEANQALAAITLRLEALAQDAPPALATDLLETKRLATQAMQELLGLARLLRPAALDDHGLVPALNGQVRRFREQTGIRAQLTTSGEPEGLGDDQQVVVYRVAQEALTNVARHSGAGSVEVDLTASGGTVELLVRDDGAGFDRHTANGHGLGLDGMSERARLVGGDLEIDAAPGRGTLIRLRVPMTGGGT